MENFLVNILFAVSAAIAAVAALFGVFYKELFSLRTRVQKNLDIYHRGQGIAQESSLEALRKIIMQDMRTLTVSYSEEYKNKVRLLQREATKLFVVLFVLLGVLWVLTMVLTAILNVLEVNLGWAIILLENLVGILIVPVAFLLVAINIIYVFWLARVTVSDLRKIKIKSSNVIILSDDGRNFDV